MIEGVNFFVIDGKKSSDYGIILTEPPLVQIPERDMEKISIPGRSGDLTIDNGRYKNATVQYTCAIISGPADQFQNVVSGFLGINQAAEYRTLEDSYFPETFRMAQIQSVGAIRSVGFEVGEFQVTFDCMPQRFLKSGNQMIRITPGNLVAVKNNTSENAKPIIMIVASGPGTGTLDLGTAKITVKGLADGDRVIIDSEAQQAFIKAPDGTTKPAGAALTMEDFPVLLPGTRYPKISGQIKGVSILPRWWTI